MVICIEKVKIMLWNVCVCVGFVILVLVFIIFVWIVMFFVRLDLVRSCCLIDSDFIWVIDGIIGRF